MLFPRCTEKSHNNLLSMFTQEHLLVLCSHILSGLCQLFLPQPQHPTYLCLMMVFRLRGEFQQLKISFINCNYKGNFKVEKYSWFKSGFSLYQGKTCYRTDFMMQVSYYLSCMATRNFHGIVLTPVCNIYY